MVILTVPKAIELHDKIRANKEKYNQYVFRRLNKYCRQITRPYKIDLAHSIIDELMKRLLNHNWNTLSNQSIEFLNNNMLLFEDFIQYTSKHPYIAVFKQIKFFPREIAVCWIVEADSVEIVFPDGSNETSKSGLRFLERPLDVNEVITLSATFYGSDYGIIDDSINNATKFITLSDPFYESLILNWLNHYNIRVSRGNMPLGQFYDGNEVVNRSYTILSEGLGDYYRQNLFFIPQSVSVANQLASEIHNEYSIGYSRLINIIHYFPKIYCHKNNDINHYIPICDSDVDYFISVINNESINSGLDTIPFQSLKEIFLRLRLEFSPIPIPLNKESLESYNTNSLIREIVLFQAPGGIFQIERGDIHQITQEIAYYHWISRGMPNGDALNDWIYAESQANNFIVRREALGSKGFWDTLALMEERRPGASMDVLEKLFLNVEDASAIYECWQSVGWDDFFETFLYIGIKPASFGRNNRKIIHLSDLHVGKNDNTSNELSTERLVQRIISEYRDETLKPAVVITGDICDYGDWQNFTTITRLLEPLRQEGYQLLPMPGNHDYCSKVSFVFSPPGSVLYEIVECIINEQGYDPDKVTGMNFDQTAAYNFQEWMKNSMGLRNWDNATVYHYRENYLKEKKGINFILVDCLDIRVGDAGGLLPDFNQFFFKDGTFRAAMGYVNEKQLLQLNQFVSNRTGDEINIICMHNWLDYLPSVNVNINQELAIMVLEKTRGYSGSGTSLPAGGQESIGFVNRLFALSMASGLISFDDLNYFLIVFRREYNLLGMASAEDLQYNYLNLIHAGRGHNPTLDVNKHECCVNAHKIRNETSLFPYIDKFDVLMAGHRHYWMNANTNYSELLHERDEFETLRRSITVDRIHNFLTRIGFFQNDFSNNTRAQNILSNLIDAITNEVKNCDLSFDPEFDLYLESGSSVDTDNDNLENKWIEMNVDLRSGYISYNFKS